MSKRHSISIIIPAYNAEPWIEATTKKITKALERAPSLKAELIIVNDGSTDDTSKASHSLHYPFPIKVIDQPNKGRFLARKAGLDIAEGDYIFFIDSRVYISQDSLTFLSTQLAGYPERKVWNGHVYVEKGGNIIARFGDAITFIGWRRYFRNPQLTSYGREDFDYYPKGTGCFFVPKDLLQWATKEFLKSTKDIRNSSDDTLLIRLIASRERIYLSPDFSCTYHARTKLQQFIKHSFGRGLFFVDGFLRPGTRFFYPLIFFLILTAVMVVTAVIFPFTIIPMLEILCVVWTLELVAAIVLGTPIKDALSLFLLSPLFAFSYGLGIWRASIKRLLGV